MIYWVILLVTILKGAPVPMRTDPAPPYWMFPELGRVLCYEPGALSDNPRIEREGMPRGAFKLVKCLPQPHPEATP